MLESYAIGIVAIVALMVAWVGVQGAWRKAFPAVAADPDALSGRMGCHGCSHTDDCRDDGACSNGPATQGVAAKEEKS